MVNPLRLPIVLVVVLTLMLLYVHAYHRRYAEVNEAPVPIRDHLQLRQPPGQVTASSYRSDSTVNAAPPSGASASSRRDTLFSSEAVRSLPLPTAEITVPAAEPVAKPRATLVGPFATEATAAPQATTALTDTFPAAAAAPPPDNVERQHAPGEFTPAEVMMHRIVDGDTLPQLADRYLGDESRYLEIMEINRDLLVQPDLLPLGVRIRIPTP